MKQKKPILVYFLSSLQLQPGITFHSLISFIFNYIFLPEINTLICSRRYVPQGGSIERSCCCSFCQSVITHYYYYLLIYLFVLTLDEFDWVLEGEEGLCDLVASSGFSMKNSQSKRLPKGDFSSSTKKNNLLTVHIRLALFFPGTLSLNVWRTKEG